MALARVLVVVGLVLARPVAAAADTTCDAAEAAELRAHLERAAHKANQWNWAWRIAFTSAAVGTFAVAAADPFPSLRDGLYVSSGKAAVGALARWILPLHVEVPDPNADTCTDIAALRRAVTKAGKKERSLFYMGHIGGILVNAAGAWIVTARASVGQGLLSVAIGYPIGLLSNYTMPRASWHLWRERTPAWTASVTPRGDGGWLVSVGGAW